MIEDASWDSFPSISTCWKVADFILLSYLGQAPAESPFIEVGQIASIYYFGFFLVIIPCLGILEKNLIKQ